MFLYKNLFFSISSILSILIMLIGINGGYFLAICWVCFIFQKIQKSLNCIEVLHPFKIFSCFAEIGSEAENEVVIRCEKISS